MQTVFLVIWENRNRIEVSKDIKSYLFRSVYNQSLNFLKRQKLELKYREMLKVIPPDYDQHILAEIEARELESILESKIRELSNAVKEVFFLSRVDGLKNKEIAEKLNISVKTVEGRITKALFVLRTTFDDYSK